MKKIILYALVIIVCLMAVACGNNMSNSENEKVGGEVSEGTELTLYNIRDYFDISASIEPGDTLPCIYDDEYVDLYVNFACEIKITGNTNYEFKNTVVNVKFSYEDPLTNFKSSKSVAVTLNLAGNGSATATLDTPARKKSFDKVSSSIASHYSRSGVSAMLDFASYEILSVSGTAVKN